MNSSAFATIIILIVFGFIGGIIYVFKKNFTEKEPPKVEPESLNSLEGTLNSITQKNPLIANITSKPKEQEEKKEVENNNENTSKESENKFKEYDYIKEIQKKNRMRKTASDEYFERTSMINNNLLDKKKSK